MLDACLTVHSSWLNAFGAWLLANGFRRGPGGWGALPGLGSSIKHQAIMLVGQPVLNRAKNHTINEDSTFNQIVMYLP